MKRLALITFVRRGVQGRPVNQGSCMRGDLRMRAGVSLLLMALLMASVNWSPGPAFAHSPAQCAPGDRQEPALQGQVPQSERLSGAAAPGYWCNLELVGGFDSRAHAAFDTYKNCAYYPDNESVDVAAGVIVLDVSDPEHPINTAYLTSRAMRSAGESLRVNQARGLLVANYYSWIGSPQPTYSADGPPESTEILRTLAVYDVSHDCAHPRLLADVVMPSAYGHEGCFQPDGMVYYMSARTFTPVDLSDPAHPRQMTEPWQSFEPLPTVAHGCSISDDGTHAHLTDAFNNQMLIVDTSQVQAHVAQPALRAVGRFPTPTELEQSTVAVTYGGRRYVVLFTEAKYPPKVCVPGEPNFGFPRIIDVSDDAHPVEVSKLQTEVVLPENCDQVAADFTVQRRGVERGDPFNLGLSGVFGYDSHYCTPDRLQDPTILACAQLGSGLRVWDIRDPFTPREIAYYNTGTAGGSDLALDWAFARPVIRRDLGQVWWTTFAEGFHVARFRDGVWPFANSDPCPSGYDYFQDQYDLSYQACQAQHAEHAD
jgi:hypothetical protein